MTIEDRIKIRHNYKDWKPRDCPYRFYDWANYFSPIEHNVWNVIRYLGLPFYPQFPVGKYFVDFASPEYKIAIEVDGKKWHLDKIKDKKREEEIEKIGWKILRIDGWKTYLNIEDFDDDGEYISHHYKNPTIKDTVWYILQNEFPQLCYYPYNLNQHEDTNI